MKRITALATLVVGCAAAQPPPARHFATVVITFDVRGEIASVTSEDLAAGDPRRDECASMVAALRASIRGPSAGEGSVTFGCPIARLSSPR